MFRRMLSLKKLRPTDRQITTPLFLLRCVQLGISIRDLDLLTIGLVNDMYPESGNDDYKGYKELATQDDFDKKSACIGIPITYVFSNHDRQLAITKLQALYPNGRINPSFADRILILSELY